MAERLYVYYRVALVDLAVAQSGALGLQSSLRLAHPGLQMELLRRPDFRDGQVTLMETYAHAEGVDEALAQAIEAAAVEFLSPWLKSPRHCECFEPLG